MPLNLQRGIFLAFLPKTRSMLTIILFLVALACFAIFFKAIDFFDKI